MLLIGREREKGRIGKVPGPSPSKWGKSRKNRESPKKDKKGLQGQVQIGKRPRLKPPHLAALERLLQLNSRTDSSSTLSEIFMGMTISNPFGKVIGPTFGDTSGAQCLEILSTVFFFTEMFEEDRVSDF